MFSASLILVAGAGLRMLGVPPPARAAPAAGRVRDHHDGRLRPRDRAARAHPDAGDLRAASATSSTRRCSRSTSRARRPRRCPSSCSSSSAAGACSRSCSTRSRSRSASLPSRRSASALVLVVPGGAARRRPRPVRAGDESPPPSSGCCAATCAPGARERRARPHRSRSRRRPIVVALILAGTAPGFDRGGATSFTAGGISIGGTVTPLIDLGRDLRRPAAVRALTYTTTATHRAVPEARVARPVHRLGLEAPGARHEAPAVRQHDRPGVRAVGHREDDEDHDEHPDRQHAEPLAARCRTRCKGVKGLNGTWSWDPDDLTIGGVNTTHAGPEVHRHQPRARSRRRNS